MQSDSEIAQYLKDAMAKVASTVAVITTSSGEGKFGIAATSVCTLSLNPPSMLVCINKSASIYEPLLESNRFAVNFLSESDLDISAAFGSSKDRDHRFAKGHWNDVDGVPQLESAVASAQCSVEQTVPFGTHVIFIGRVTQIATKEGAPPLIYLDRKYHLTSSAN